jgi:hypothetical protein
MNETIQDPLKPMGQIYEPDERQASFSGTIEDRHNELQKVTLSDTVPLGVRQLFETAKNLSLYSWFVYRFHQVSELMAFTALEMALRERYLAENPIDPEKNQRSPALYKLMQHAKLHGWITQEGFSDSYEFARYQAKNNKKLNKMKAHDFEKEPSMSIDEPTPTEISEALANSDRVGGIANNIHKIRNNLAHGSNLLHPNSVTTLHSNAEMINQIYSK